MNKFFLAADIGATKTNIGLFQPSAGGLKQIAVRNFMSCGEDELIHRVKEFLSAKLLQGELVAACFGVAGPVVDGRVEATNLGLKLDQRDLQKELDCSNLWLVND
ncbi:MAG: glucokinase, partial [Deltaproteobacteria bacterium]|nr:glucokinase [Deltaproteobacteria bacterium]